MKRIRVAFLFAVLLALPALSQPAPSMTAHFINVGQAHATLLEFSCGAMLVDAGAQDDAHEQTLIDYLEGFFSRGLDLNRTLAAILITHNHIDHTLARAILGRLRAEGFGGATVTARRGPFWLESVIHTAAA